MIRNHDQWSKMGEEHLGEMNIQWAQKMEEFPHTPPGWGPMTLMKAIMNDYWADAPSQTAGWDREMIDMIMSKLYWCWVAALDCAFMEASEDED